MIETNLRHEDLIKNEPMLENYKHDNQVNYQESISTAYGLMVQDIKNQNIEIRRLCKKLWLQETAKTTTTAYNSAESKEDRVERLRWVIQVTALTTAPAIFTLQGRNSSSETWTSIRTVQVEEKGNHKYLVLEIRPNIDLEIYKYYRIQKVDTTSTVTYKSYLVEMTYENLHLWRTLALIFENLTIKGEDIFRSKADKYMQIYMDYLVNNKYYYDEDDDGEISESEAESDYRNIVIGRG
jgi:hypothetical protein